MAALTTALWFIGRVLRLDALLMLLYPLPTMYIAARWGLGCSDLCLCAGTFLIFTLLGPLFAQSYFLNTGLLASTYARCLWYRWSFWPTLLAGATAKAVGLVTQLAWVSIMLRYSAWDAVTIQVTQMIAGLCTLVNRLCGRIVWATPGLGAVQIGVAVVVALHSLYLVFFTLLTSALFLKGIQRQHRIARAPPEVPGLRWLLRRAKGPPERYGE